VARIPHIPAYRMVSNGFHTGENRHPATTQLLKHCRAVHNQDQPVKNCPACRDIQRKIEDE
jgi:hypothetical protein